MIKVKRVLNLINELITFFTVMNVILFGVNPVSLSLVQVLGRED